jgi:hypothetical protein
LKHFPTLCLLHLTLVPGSSGNSWPPSGAVWGRFHESVIDETFKLLLRLLIALEFQTIQEYCQQY